MTLLPSKLMIKTCALTPLTTGSVPTRENSRDEDKQDEDDDDEDDEDGPSRRFSSRKKMVNRDGVWSGE